MQQHIDDRSQLNTLFNYDALLAFSRLPRVYQTLIEAIPLDKWLQLSDDVTLRLLRGEMDGPELKATLKRCGIGKTRIKEILGHGSR